MVKSQIRAPPPTGKGRIKAHEWTWLAVQGPLPGARRGTGAGAHGKHAGVGRHPQAGPVVVGLEHRQTGGGGVGIGYEKQDRVTVGGVSQG